jgi:hypothetical protein
MASGPLRGRQRPRRGTQIKAINGPNIGESFPWPVPIKLTSGRPLPSTIAWVLVLRHQRDRSLP